MRSTVMPNVDKGRLIRWLEVHRPTVVSSRWLACFFSGHMLPVQQIQSKSSPIPGENSLVCVCVHCEYYMERLFICV